MNIFPPQNKEFIHRAPFIMLGEVSSLGIVVGDPPVVGEDLLDSFLTQQHKASLRAGAGLPYTTCRDNFVGCPAHVLLSTHTLVLQHILLPRLLLRLPLLLGAVRTSLRLVVTTGR